MSLSELKMAIEKAIKDHGDGEIIVKENGKSLDCDVSLLSAVGGYFTLDVVVSADS